MHRVAKTKGLSGLLKLPQFSLGSKNFFAAFLVENHESSIFPSATLPHSVTFRAFAFTHEFLGNTKYRERTNLTKLRERLRSFRARGESIENLKSTVGKPEVQQAIMDTEQTNTHTNADTLSVPLMDSGEQTSFRCVNNFEK